MSSQLGGVGDIYCCGRSSEGKLKAPADHLRARKVSFLFGKYSRAALLEDGRVFWLDGKWDASGLDADDTDTLIIGTKYAVH